MTPTPPDDTPPLTGAGLDYGPAGDGDGTRVVRAGLPAEEPYEPPLPGPVFAAHYHLPGEVEGAPYAYGRDANPTWTRLERAIAELEAPEDPEAEVVVFSSGMGAISAVLLSLTRPGQTVVLPCDGYNLLAALRERLEGFGVRVRTAPTGGDAQLSEVEGASLLWLETPSNPGLDVCDIRRLAHAAHEQGALVAVDNTLATPLGQRPLLLGADISVASGTKALTGHGDVLLGYVATRSPEVAAAVRAWRKTVGAIPGPMEAWLAHRSLATLEVRTQRQAGNALAVAEALAARPEVGDVRHPGLTDDPAHALASHQMSRYGCVVSFTLPDQAHANRFLARLRLVGDATSFGGVRSTAERRGRWGGDPVPEGFVRLSVGVEDSADLVRDIRRALDASAAPASGTGADGLGGGV
ncbi:cystathionine gamma-lyase [Streptomyces tubbatahanensis]|uniref:Cystathionine gamma-lyase n=1 Tax=Streptomyces tubbatahanensis TaxID=2923272 RepID=A0ABY3XTQ4_9ACTN|nr:cystathionine gamma-lyase [Streptomyces tubbatahanensis]UNS97874.1 cystathionine gamma-lyase [Streptomyces tubbatahanensis]